MSEPTDDVQNKEPGKGKSIQDQVNDIVKGVTTVDGKIVMPEGEFSPELEYAAKVEIRRRATEGAYATEKTKRKVAEDATDALEREIGSLAKFKPTGEQSEELEALLESNPEAWRNKLNEYERDAQKTARADLSKVKTEAKANTLAKERAEQLKAFNTLHSDANLSPELIEQAVPKMHFDKLDNGEITYADFLVVANTYANTGATIDTEQVEEKIDLSDVPGGSDPSKDDVNSQGASDYKDTIY